MGSPKAQWRISVIILRLQKIVEQVQHGAIFSTLQRFWYGLNFRRPKQPRPVSGIIIFRQSASCFVLGVVKGDWLTGHISMLTQFSHHHVGLSQERYQNH